MSTIHEQDAAPAASRAVASSAGVSARRARGVALLLLAVAVAAVASLAVGARPLGLEEVWGALVAPEGSEADVIVREIRVPRTVLGLLVGMALGLAGALIQGHTRNPLADPGLLGVSAGAALGVVVAVSVGLAGSLTAALPYAAVGALVASVVVFVIGSVGRAGATPVTMALAGIAITVLLEAIVTVFVLLDLGTLDAFRTWSVGSLADRGSDVVWAVLPVLVVGVILALVNARNLDTVSLGDDVARALGVRVGRVRAVGVVAVTLLTAAAVAACGPIAFVGLVVPHAVRAFTGPDYRWLVPMSGLAGAALLVAADVVGRVVVRPGELAAGLVLAFVGGPVFVAIVRRRRMVAV